MYEDELNELQNPPPWIGARKASAIVLDLESRWLYWTTENVRVVSSIPLTDGEAKTLAAACNAEDPHGLGHKTLSTVFSELKEGNEI